MTLQFDPHLVYGQFSLTRFDPWLRKMCNAPITDIPFNRYKQNWSCTCDLSGNGLVFPVAFLFFLSGILFLKENFRIYHQIHFCPNILSF